MYRHTFFTQQIFMYDIKPLLGQLNALVVNLSSVRLQMNVHITMHSTTHSEPGTTTEIRISVSFNCPLSLLSLPLTPLPPSKPSLPCLPPSSLKQEQDCWYLIEFSVVCVSYWTWRTRRRRALLCCCWPPNYLFLLRWLQDLELRWQEYYELVTILLQWIRHHVTIFEEKKFPASYEEIEVRYSAGSMPLGKIFCFVVFAIV